METATRNASAQHVAHHLPAADPCVLRWAAAVASAKSRGPCAARGWRAQQVSKEWPPEKPRRSEGQKNCARTKWVLKEWVQCPTADLVHFEQGSLSTPPRPVHSRQKAACPTAAA
eukprot:6953140-Pyramimonas_sp.AAC.1